MTKKPADGEAAETRTFSVRLVRSNYGHLDVEAEDMDQAYDVASFSLSSVDWDKHTLPGTAFVLDVTDVSDESDDDDEYGDDEEDDDDDYVPLPESL